MKAFFIKTLHGLSPGDERSARCLSGLKLNQLVQVEVSRPRNVQHHRLYWAMCQKIADNVPGINSAEEVSDILKINTGHCTTIKGATQTYKLPKSIAFAQMDQQAFNEFFDKCCQVIATEWLRHMTGNEVKDTLTDMMGGNDMRMSA